MVISKVRNVVFLLIALFYNRAEAGDFGVGVHGGYGVVKYSEQTSALGKEIKSRSSQEAMLVGISLEYTFSRSFFAAIVTDWVSGFKDGEETWYEEGIKTQTDEMQFRGQFYDFRVGYKGQHDKLYYRLYASGGWEGLHFKRSNFVVISGGSADDGVAEDFSLWYAGLGVLAGHRWNKWAINGNISYSYFYDGSIDNDSLPQFTFETNGTCLDTGLALTRRITDSLSLHVGASYAVIELDESDVMTDGVVRAVFPEGKLQMAFAVVSLTVSF